MGFMSTAVTIAVIGVVYVLAEKYIKSRIKEEEKKENEKNEI